MLKRKMRQKEDQVRKKLREVEQQRLTELEVKRERQKLVQDDARKRMEFKKRN